jgi:hypothetical protein
MKNLFDSKQGNVTDSIVAVLLIAFGFAISSIFAYHIYSSMTTEMMHVEATNSTIARTTLTGFDKAMNLFDYIIVFFMFISILAVGIASYYSFENKIFVIVMWLFAIFIGVASYVLSYIFKQMTDVSVLSTTMAHFPKTAYIMGKLHWVALLMIIVATIVVYARPAGEMPPVSGGENDEI